MRERLDPAISGTAPSIRGSVPGSGVELRMAVKAISWLLEFGYSPTSSPLSLIPLRKEYPSEFGSSIAV